MDADRFDALSRSLTTMGSRRTLTMALVGALAVLGLAGPDDAAAAKSGKCKRKPSECETCKKGKCERKDGKKRCKAGKIQPKAPGTPCTGGTCQNGQCTCPGERVCAGNCCSIGQYCKDGTTCTCELEGALCGPSKGGAVCCSGQCGQVSPVGVFTCRKAPCSSTTCTGTADCCEGGCSGGNCSF